MLVTIGALKHSGPLLGYNNNVPYKGDVFHVQTEDSGSKRPHVFTHLFADGGRVVKTTKTSYAHYVGNDNLTDRVRALMREQHKGMVLGKGGSAIKAIGKAAREELTDLLGQTVHLILFVKVDPKWMDRREAYTAYGLEFDV